MTASRWKTYPETKASGIEWLGQVPAHWKTWRLKQVATINDEALGEDTDPDYEIAYVDIGNVDATRGILEKEGYRFENAPSRARRIVRDGDVIVSTVRTYLKAIAPISDPEPNLIVSTGFAVVRPRRVLGTSFAAYALRAPYFVERVVAESVGVSYPAINAWQLGTFRVAAPDREEQQAIAGYLDRETARIDALVERKERLIELLQEKRTALITHAVTKGLDPDVPMKDSVIEWVGQIPAHWNLKPLKHVASFINGIAFSPSEWGSEGTPIIRIGNLNGGEDFNYTEREVPAAFHAFKGDLLFGWSGNRGTSFGPFLWWAEGRHFVNQHIFRVCGFSVDKQWLYWILKAATQHVEERAHGIIGMVHITRGELGAIAVPVFAKAEQRSIADYLDRETGKIDALIAKVQEATERLKEYRTALISAAVAGKIDVRDEAGRARSLDGSTKKNA